MSDGMVLTIIGALGATISAMAGVLWTVALGWKQERDESRIEAKGMVADAAILARSTADLSKQQARMLEMQEGQIAALLLKAAGGGRP